MFGVFYILQEFSSSQTVITPCMAWVSKHHFFFLFSLVKAAKIKGCSELKEWIESIVNHFWFCSQTSEGSEEKIKVRMMFGPCTAIKTHFLSFHIHGRFDLLKKALQINNRYHYD